MSYINYLINRMLGDDRADATEAVLVLRQARNPEAVEPLAALLDNPNRWIRMQAAELLGHLGDSRAVEPLIRVLTTNDSYAKRMAIDALGKLQDRRAVEPLIECLKSNDSDCRWSAASALGGLGDRRAVGPLIEILSRDNADLHIRVSAAQGLGKLKDLSAVDYLVSNLKRSLSGYTSLPKTIAEALGELGDRRAVDQLIEVAKIGDDDMAPAAALALGKLQDRRAVDPLIACLNQRSWASQAAAATALGQLGDPRAVVSLISTLTNAGGQFEVRSSAARALGKLKDARAVAPLIQALQDDQLMVQASATVALGELDAIALPLVTQALQNEMFSVRRNLVAVLDLTENRRAADPLIVRHGTDNFPIWEKVIRAQARSREVDIVPMLLPHLENSNERIRIAAAETFGELRDPRAIAPLRTLLDHPNWQTRTAATLALTKYGSTALEVLLGVLKDTRDTGPRFHALQALGFLKDPRIIPALVLACKDKYRHVRIAAAQAIGGIGDPSAVGAVIGLLDDRDRGVQNSAALALKKINTEEALTAVQAWDRHRRSKLAPYFAEQ